VLQVVVPYTKNPGLQPGVQLVPEFIEAGQLPMFPLGGATGVHVLLALQVAKVVLPSLQEVLPEGVYPVAQVGWQEPP
jgi:hypothetical protein